MAAWRADVEQVGIQHAIMIARDNETRAQLNEQAREWREQRGALGQRIAIEGREVAVGNRVIARRNDRELDVDNGTRGTIRAVNAETQAMTIETDTGDLRRLPADYVAEHLEYAYALTGHGSQGATVERAVVIGVPEDFTNEWAYTALSRARDPVRVHVAAGEPDRSGRAEIAPVAPDRTAEESIEAMRAAMVRHGREELAIERVDQHPPVPGEAAAEAIERGQRQQLSLDSDGASTVPEPVPDMLRAVREPEALSAVEHRIGLDQRDRKAIERARETMTGRPGDELAARAERLAALLETYPVGRGEAANRAHELSHLREEWREAHGARADRADAEAVDASRRSAKPSAPATSTARSTPTGMARAACSTSTATSWSTSLRPRSSCTTATLGRAADGSTTSAATRPNGSPSASAHDPTSPPPASAGTAPPPTSTTTATRSASHPATSYPGPGDTASVTPGNGSTMPPPKPSTCIPNGPSSNDRRRSSTATSDSASDDDLVRNEHRAHHRAARVRLEAMRLEPTPPPASLREPLLTCQEAAKLLAVKPAWIYAAARSGKLTCVRIGRNVRLLRSDLEQFVAEQRGR